MGGIVTFQIGERSMEHYRQGDILFVKVDKLPGNKRKQVKNGVVALGEATGHAHRVRDGHVWDFEPDLFVEAEVATKVVHEEHNTIPLPKGIYKVVRQREYVDDTAERFVND